MRDKDRYMQHPIEPSALISALRLDQAAVLSPGPERL